MQNYLSSTTITILIFCGSAFGTEIKFNRDIRPLLSDRCFHCHGPDEEDRQAGLRLDRADGPEGAHEFAITPGALKDSELYTRITSDDPDLVMPPADSHKKPLTDDEQDLIRQWIEQGAEYEGFWAFIPPATSLSAAEIKGAAIDQLVGAKIEAEGLTPAPEADKRTLIRRLTLDLTGLPPSRDEISAFLADDSEQAHADVVDRLMSSPRYGEHMARYWLDLVRFADTNGIHHDHYRDMSPYRGWVIRAFNDNLPYDDFVRYQLAGDLYPEPTQDQWIASGFHRLHLIIDRGTMLPEESFTRNVLDRVTSVGTAFLGLTVQCAVCHDHKYDPLTMKDLYCLSAFFNNIDAEPETGGRQGTDFLRGLQPPYINLHSTQQAVELITRNAEIDAAEARLASLKKELDLAVTDQAKKQALESVIKSADQKLKAAKKSRDDHLLTIPAAMIMKELAEVRPAHILIRGAYDNPGEQVSRATPSFLPPMKNVEEIATRMDLANWLVDPANPLTARVTVNRLWQQLFGVGLVKTSEDFGAQGEWPSHPKLLDYLAVRFVEIGWNVRELMREIVMSRTYRQSSFATPEDFRRDPENRSLARGSRFRLDSEMIRDSILATSGLLNVEMYGKSVKPPQPPGLCSSYHTSLKMLLSTLSAFGLLASWTLGVQAANDSPCGVMPVGWICCLTFSRRQQMSVSIMDEVLGAKFGDKRLDERLGTIAEEFANHPNVSIPAATTGRAEMEAAYRFFDNDKVTSDKILEPHFQATRKRISQHDVVLLVQDTTELDLTRPERQVRGAGPMDSEARRGAFLHPLQAFDLNAIPLGMVWQKSWTRDEVQTELTSAEKSKKRKETPIEDKESLRWVEGLRASREVAKACPETTCICVGDSEADIYELFSESRATPENNLQLLVRACQTRATADQSNWLDKVRATPCLYTCSVDVSARRAKIAGDKQGKRSKPRDARVAEVEIRATTVTLRPPYRPDRKLPEVTVNVVLVEEANPPAGCEPIQWLLITTMPIDTAEQVQAIVSAYCIRWQIEIFFKTLKTGCRVEQRQFETIDRILNCLAVYSIVAWRIMHLCRLGRECPDLDCEVVFEPCEWKAVYTAIKREDPPQTPPRLNEMVRLVASLGGYVIRKSTQPGPQTLWIGLQRVHDLSTAWEAFGPDS